VLIARHPTAVPRPDKAGRRARFGLRDYGGAIAAIFGDDSAMETTPITLKRKAFLRAAFAILIFLNLGNAVAVYAMAVMELEFALGVVPLFNLDGEQNLPTLFSGLLLYSAALLAYAVSHWSATHEPARRRGWLGVALTLAFLATDELAGIHEALNFILLDRLETDGALAWPWVIPYALLALVVGVYFLRFFLGFDAIYRRLLIVAGGLYAGSAIGFEMLEALVAPAEGESLNITYAIFYTLEENGEMLGTLIACHTFMRFLSEKCGGFGGTIHVVSET
jgi:hypothetical protein